MQVLCMASNSNDDRAAVVCPTCGQRYSIYYSRQSTQECESALLAVHTALLSHHESDPTRAAHRSDIFNVPAWSGPAHMSGAALLSGAPLRPASHSDAPSAAPQAS